MATMTFQINDASTELGYPAVWVSITENADGTLTFKVWQEGGIVGDLRGLFFDVADESILKSLVITAASTDIRIGDDSIKDLGDGSNMNGLTGSDKGYDIGIEIGTSGIGKDDIREYTFTLDSTARDLTLADLGAVDFAARLTSVGIVGGTRADSSKILELTSLAADAKNDLKIVSENAVVTGNVLTNDATGGTSTVTSWSGGEVGDQVALASGEDIIGTVQLNADGTYTVDANAADELSAGESIVYTFNYDMMNQTEATSWSEDSGTFTVVINGVNDGPVAQDDAGGSVAEDQVLTGDVTGNDSDVDRLDTHTYALASEWDGPGELTFNEDGTWSYDAGGAYDHLNDGESVNLSFQYTMTDDHGASDTATVSFTVNGVGGDGGGDGDGGTGGGGGGDGAIYTADDSYPTFQKDISHAILVFATDAYDKDTYGDNVDPANDGYYTVKFDFGDGVTSPDLDTDIDALLAWLVANDQYVDENTVLLGAQIKGGNIGTTNSYDDYWANDGGDLYNLVQIGTSNNGNPIYEWQSTDQAIVDLDQVSQSQGGTLDQQYVYVDDNPFTIA